METLELLERKKIRQWKETAKDALKGCPWMETAKDTLKGWIKEEFVGLIKLNFPIFCTLFSMELNYLLSLVFIGQISGSVLETDAAGLAVSVLYITALSVVLGMSTGLDTLCSQAFGSKHYKRVGLVLQQGVFVIGLTLFPIWALWLNIKPLLLVIGQNSCVVELVSLYLLVFAFALPFLFLNYALTRYLTSQSIVLPMVINGIITNGIMVAISITFLYGFHFGFIGAVFAMTLSLGSAPLFLLVYIWACALHKQTWGGWTWESLIDWWTFTKLAVPGLFMIGLEIWSFQIGVIIMGTINNIQLGIYVVLLNIYYTLFMIPLSIGISVSIRVGNALGAGNVNKAKRVILIGALMTICELSVIVILLLSLQYQVGRFFTSDENVIQGVASLMKVFAPMICAEHLQIVLSGALRGSGRQLVGAITIFVSYYIIGQPIGISLALAIGLGALGHWIGLLCATAVQVSWYILILVRTDWNAQSQRAIKNAELRSEKECKASHKVLFIYYLLAEATTSENEVHGLQNRKIKLLLYRGLFLICGIVILVAGGLGKHYISFNNYTECNSTNATNRY